MPGCCPHHHHPYPQFPNLQHSAQLVDEHKRLPLFWDGTAPPVLREEGGRPYRSLTVSLYISFWTFFPHLPCYTRTTTRALFIYCHHTQHTHPTLPTACPSFFPARTHRVTYTCCALRDWAWRTRTHYTHTRPTHATALPSQLPSHAHAHRTLHTPTPEQTPHSTATAVQHTSHSSARHCRGTFIACLSCTTAFSLCATAFIFLPTNGSLLPSATSTFLARFMQPHDASSADGISMFLYLRLLPPPPHGGGCCARRQRRALQHYSGLRRNGVFRCMPALYSPSCHLFTRTTMSISSWRQPPFISLFYTLTHPATRARFPGLCLPPCPTTTPTNCPLTPHDDGAKHSAPPSAYRLRAALRARCLAHHHAGQRVLTDRALPLGLVHA